jgi:hypothetical protein
MVEVENIVTLKHQAENSMNCTGVHNLQAPNTHGKELRELFFFSLSNKLVFLKA